MEAILYSSQTPNKLDVSCAHSRGIMSVSMPRNLSAEIAQSPRDGAMQLPILPTVSVYFKVFSVIMSPLPASQEPKGKESPFSRAALTVGFFSAVADDSL